MRFHAVVDGSGAASVITLRDQEAGCRAEIYAFGSLLNCFGTGTYSNFTNIIHGFASPQDAQTNLTTEFRGAKLSPFVCRLRYGSYTFNGVPYKVDRYYFGEHAIHGLLYNAVFTVKEMGSTGDSAFVLLEYNYAGDDPGFPFPYRMQVCRTLQEGGRLHSVTSVTNKHSSPIPIADGWHPYFAPGETIDDCVLTFNCRQKLAYGEDLMPAGGFISDERFLNGCSLANLELDTAFVPPEGERATCTLQNNKVRLTVEAGENYPYLQFYTPPGRKSIAIENLSSAPDSFNNGVGAMVLPAGETRRFSTMYRVELLESDPTPQQKQ